MEEPKAPWAGNQIEMALRDSEERLRGFLETVAEGIITIDERGVIESVNPAAQRLFDMAVSTHNYRIAQEAISDAIRPGGRMRSP